MYIYPGRERFLPVTDIVAASAALVRLDSLPVSGAE
jgi:hypothetical protein